PEDGQRYENQPSTHPIRPRKSARSTSFNISTAGRMDAERTRRRVHSHAFIGKVWKTGRSAGTRTAIKWMAALRSTAPTSASGTIGRNEKKDCSGERQLNAWRSGLKASREKAIARACLTARRSSAAVVV